MFDADLVLRRIADLRTLIDRHSKAISDRYEDADRGRIGPEDLVLANEEDLKCLHDLALSLSAAFGELSDGLEFGEMLPELWREARLPTF